MKSDKMKEKKKYIINGLDVAEPDLIFFHYLHHFKLNGRPKEKVERPKLRSEELKFSDKSRS